MSVTLEVGMRVVIAGTAPRRGIVGRIHEGFFDVVMDDSKELEVVKFADNWCEEKFLPAEPSSLRDDIERAVNSWSAENGSNTPDFVLANFLQSCLLAFDAATKRRDEWWQNRSLKGEPGVNVLHAGEAPIFSRRGLMPEPALREVEPEHVIDKPAPEVVETPLPPIYEGMRVYHRQRDFFGTVVAVDLVGKDRAMVKYEWPYDPKAPAVEVRRSELVPSSEVE